MDIGLNQSSKTCSQSLCVSLILSFVIPLLRGQLLASLAKPCLCVTPEVSADLSPSLISELKECLLRNHTLTLEYMLYKLHPLPDLPVALIMVTLTLQVDAASCVCPLLPSCSVPTSSSLEHHLYLTYPTAFCPQYSAVHILAFNIWLKLKE